jgi:acyl-[acyl-carrier-protein]-phospholipid O-acyltransferase/long-chain-fatty-acid--[acyl-carrier-protein] ligase
MVLISGAQVMQGYLNNPEKTAEVLRTINGTVWYVSGDKGYLDEDGFLFIQDRYSRFAKIGGEMVGLGKVEQAIRDVVQNPDLELVAINLPDEKKGEKIVVLTNTEIDGGSLRDQLLASGLTPLALPSQWITVEQIPTLGSGKKDFARARNLAVEATTAIFEN